MALDTHPDDLTIENLTTHAINIGSNIDDERVKFISAKLIQHSHDFVRETKLTTDEWELAWQYMTRVCFVLLKDVHTFR